MKQFAVETHVQIVCGIISMTKISQVICMQLNFLQNVKNYFALAPDFFFLIQAPLPLSEPVEQKACSRSLVVFSIRIIQLSICNIYNNGLANNTYRASISELA